MKAKTNFCNIVCYQHTGVTERTRTTLKGNYRRLSSCSITVERLLIKHDTISGVGGRSVRIIMSGLRTVGTAIRRMVFCRRRLCVCTNCVTDYLLYRLFFCTLSTTRRLAGSPSLRLARAPVAVNLSGDDGLRSTYPHFRPVRSGTNNRPTFKSASL